MYHTWLGVLASIIVLGVVTLMGLTIFHGEELVMQRENWELAQILVPSIVSVFGWFVTIWWALRQIEISSQKNRNLQHEMLQSNEKNKIVDSVIITYTEINKLLCRIDHVINNLKANIEYEYGDISIPVLENIFINSGDAYSEMFENIKILEIKLARLYPYDIDVIDSIDFIMRISDCFADKSVWVTYQKEAIEYFVDQKRSLEELISAIDAVSSNCQEISKGALEAVKKLNNINKSSKKDAQESRVSF